MTAEKLLPFLEAPAGEWRLERSGLATRCRLAAEALAAGRSSCLLVRDRDELHNARALFSLFVPDLSVGDVPLERPAWRSPCLALPDTAGIRQGRDVWAAGMAAFRALAGEGPHCVVAGPESLLLRLAEEHLKYQVPARIMSALTPLFESARHALNETSASSKQNAWMQKVAFVPDSIALMPPTILMRIFNSVSEALYRDSKLDIEYQNVSGECKKRTVSPLGLVQQEHRLYLICKFDGYDDIRHLALHRIKTAEVLDFAADRPHDFRLQEYIAQRHVNYSNGGKVHFIVEFTNPVTKTILEETPFNRTQTIESLPDGAWRLEAIMDDTVLLDGWVAAWKTTAGIRRVEKKPIK